MIDAKVKKGSLIQIIGDQELEEYQKRDGTTGWNAKLTLVPLGLCSYDPCQRRR